jgi:hypothetical protein
MIIELVLKKEKIGVVTILRWLIMNSIYEFIEKNELCYNSSFEFPKHFYLWSFF